MDEQQIQQIVNSVLGQLGESGIQGKGLGKVQMIPAGEHAEQTAPAGSLYQMPASAAEPGWSPVIIATGEYGEKIRSMPLEKRPYRPFHIYGNTVRRMHHRGNPLPLPRSFPTPSQLIPRFGLLR